ncbi:MAG TPA: hypothetical protein VKW08_09510 [Xanthobacteraceae bacterium]|nr:hypothetical protein [Xanthobacteraceae bacterium]
MQQLDRIKPWLGHGLAFAAGLALGAVIIDSIPVAPAASPGSRYIQSTIPSDNSRFAFATRIVVQTDRMVAAPFEVKITSDQEIGDADWDLIGYREQNPEGPSAQPLEPEGNTFTIRILKPDFVPQYTVMAVLYSQTELNVKSVDVRSKAK